MIAKVIGVAVGSVAAVATASFVAYKLGWRNKGEFDQKLMETIMGNKIESVAKEYIAELEEQDAKIKELESSLNTVTDALNKCNDTITNLANDLARAKENMEPETIDGIDYHRFVASFVTVRRNEKDFEEFLHVLAKEGIITQAEIADIYTYCTCGNIMIEGSYIDAVNRNKDA